MTKSITRFGAAILAAAVLAFTGAASFAASEFEGKWKVSDSAGKAFEITLARRWQRHCEPWGRDDRHVEGRWRGSSHHLEYRLDDKNLEGR